QSDQPTINAIKAFAYDRLEKADAIWIPGGPDLHPEFYGENNTDSWPSSNYYREILEFSLTEAALALGKPILGICHGSQ
ncbi:MAG TPA: gamma-glutamyl-gamma-aminobutyrate hydrolase family protein, partial [Candidatus Berkiella sp.]|nr:gamma-glutamyl-gamma-aminobutyrate hydrolase family protein [Candidatus Berkiella sp.]